MLGPERIHEIGTALGAGVPTGIDLDETTGELGTPESTKEKGGTWYSASSVVLGIGQGHVTATPLQAARWTAAIASGQLVTPRLGLDFAAPDHPASAVPAPPPAPLPFAGVLGPVREGMRQVVLNGTAAILKDLPLSVMAKTGTAEDPSSTNGDTERLARGRRSGRRSLHRAGRAGPRRRPRRRDGRPGGEGGIAVLHRSPRRADVAPPAAPPARDRQPPTPCRLTSSRPLERLGMDSA